jgi:hypothetical protein
MSEFEPAIEWLRRQGHRIVLSPSAYWYDVVPGVYQAFPYHWLIEPSNEELCQVMRETRGYGLRYSAPLRASVGKISYHVVYSGPGYGMEQITRQARQAALKGIEYSEIKPISFTCLAEEGWILRAETLARQGRSKAENHDWWRKLCLSAEGLPGFEAWGAIREGKLVAALLAFITNGCCIWLNQQSRTEYLKFGINNALTFVFTQKALARPGIKELFYGFQSLDAPRGVDEFKFRMGYTAKPIRQRILLHPVSKLAVNRVTLAAIEYLSCRFLRSPSLRKAAGMIRFYLEGKRPLAKQIWPECLLAQKAELLLKQS